MNNIIKLVGFLAILTVTQQSMATTTYVIGVEDLSYLPHYSSNGGDYRGYARDVLDAFAASKNIRFKYRPLPVTRLFQFLVNGKIDFKYPDSPHWNPTVKNGVEVTYSSPVAPYVDGVMVRPENLKRKPGDFRKLGTVTGFTPYAWLDRLAEEGVNLHENPSFSGLLRQTIAGRVDGAYVNEAVARHYMRFQLQRPEALVFKPALPHVRDNYYLSTTKHSGLIDELNQWLETRAGFVAAKQQEWGIVEN